jgi:hypothetical protein
VLSLFIPGPAVAKGRPKFAVHGGRARYARVTAACNAVSARIDAHGADGLAAFCAAYLGSGETMGTAILGLVLRRLGRDARDEVREVLCL